MRILQVSAAALILLLGSAGYGQEAAQNRVIAVIGTDGVQRVEITGGSYYFNPNDIVVKVNVPVELNVKKERDDSSQHRPQGSRSRDRLQRQPWARSRKRSSSRPPKSGPTPFGAPNARLCFEEP